MVTLALKTRVRGSEIGDLCLGFKKIALLFNAGPFPGGGDCLIVSADGELTTINSNDLIHDLEAYNIRQTTP
jgi:hypothetical protein